jgi:hypothetical protein
MGTQLLHTSRLIQKLATHRQLVAILDEPHATLDRAARGFQQSVYLESIVRD